MILGDARLSNADGGSNFANARRRTDATGVLFGFSGVYFSVWNRILCGNPHKINIKSIYFLFIIDLCSIDVYELLTHCASVSPMHSAHVKIESHA